MAMTTSLQRHANEGESIAETIRDCLNHGEILKRQKVGNTHPPTNAT